MYTNIRKKINSGKVSLENPYKISFGWGMGFSDGSIVSLDKGTNLANEKQESYHYPA